ncbi:hypothetical protein [Ferrovibrio xuzhouensis]|uniref:DUF1330 domain-containing protein n=1 Tax=Ferrovibrio xuzhouensis TaxID=1576914 RepID=A0ABV7VL08_9PROT
MNKFSIPMCFIDRGQQLGAALEAFIADAKPMAKCRTFAEALDNLQPGFAAEDGSYGRETERQYMDRCRKKGVKPWRRIAGAPGKAGSLVYNPIWRIVFFDPETLEPVATQLFFEQPAYHKVVEAMPDELYDMGALFTFDEVEVRVPVQ